MNRKAPRRLLVGGDTGRNDGWIEVEGLRSNVVRERLPSRMARPSRFVGVEKSNTVCFLKNATQWESVSIRPRFVGC